ncbi:neutral zinc metallopeptidase [Planomonospora corallina]|uniref:Neutral zinc metallopeptidase n=1 Tax=Planomonospora corallina TaxID=1806052 RepID=A0ABV8IEH5_9ACTN
MNRRAPLRRPPAPGGRRAASARRAPVSLAAAVLLAAVPSGAAQAAPPKPLGETGRLAASSCPEPPLIDGGVPRTREYLTAAVRCLNRAWSAHLSRAGLPFRAPRVRFHDAPGERACGDRPWPDADAFHCADQGTVVFMLTGEWIEGRTDLHPLKVAAHEYGHHLQSLTGIHASYAARFRARGARRAELRRRYELQADCLSGVFLGSVRRSLKRTGQDWEELFEAVRRSGDGDGTHGSGANRLRWFKRGYGALSPAACDTWTAGASRVS